MLTALIRTVILYGVIIFSVRVMGKRQLGQLQPAELVITIMISNIATLPVEDTSVPLLGSVIPILTMMGIEMAVSGLSLHSVRIRRFFAGTPVLVIREGKIDQAAMKQLRFTADDLFEELRAQNISDLSEVRLALMETTGKLTVCRYLENQEVTNDTLRHKRPDTGLSLPIAADGCILKDAARLAGIGEEEIQRELRRRGLSLSDVYCMTADLCRNITVIKKDHREKKEEQK